MKNLKKALAVILSIAILVQITPMGVWAASEKTQTRRLLKALTPVPAAPGMAGPAERFFSGPESLAVTDSELSVTPIIGEAVEYRDETTKHFRHEDGTFTAAMFPEPVHFQDASGRWQDINNSLVLNSDKRSAADQATYTPAASGLDIRIPQDFADGQQLTIGKDGYTVGLGIVVPDSGAQPEQDDADVAEEEPATEEPTTSAPIEETTVAVEEQPTTKEATTVSLDEETTAAEDGQTTPEATTAASLDEETTAAEEEQLVTREAMAAPPADEIIATEEDQPAPVDEVEEKIIAPATVKAEVNNDYAARATDEASTRTKAGTIEAANAEKMKAGNLSSAVIYRGMFPGADLEYILTPTKIKENIIVKEAQEKYEYLFNLSLDGLIPVPQEDGSIYLMKEAEDEDAAEDIEGPKIAEEPKPLFILEAPYMYDAAGEESTALSMELAADGTLTLTADAAWINAGERKFPVAIDPTITTGTYYINSVIVSEANPTTNYYGSNDPYMYAGGGVPHVSQPYSSRTAHRQRCDSGKPRAYAGYTHRQQRRH